MKSHITPQLVNFIRHIGIDVVFNAISHETFVPGITIAGGKIIVDENKMTYPGDLLHEAGHIAVTPRQMRCGLSNGAGFDEAFSAGNEMAAIAWSYAACRHLNIDAAIVFHQQGYKGQSKHILDNLAAGQYIGLPLLQWYGMAFDDKQAAQLNAQPYPKMLNWLSQH